MTDADIHAFTPAPAGAPLAPTPARGRGWRRLGLAAAVLVLLALAAAAVLLAALAAMADHGVTLVLDDEVFHGPVLEWSAWAVVGALCAVAVVLLLVPVLLALVFVTVGFALAVALLAVLGVLVLATAPLWLPALVIWWLVRPRRRAVAGAA